MLLHKVGHGQWRAQVSDAQTCNYDDVSTAVAAARTAGELAHDEFKIKVAEGTELDEADVLAIMEANGGSLGLDLSHCRMLAIDLSPETIRRERDEYQRNGKGAYPRWFSPVTGGVSLLGAQLQGSDLMMAQLQRADLSWAQLQGADLRSAKLQGADLYNDVSLEGTRWDGAFLDRTRIRRESLGSAIGDESDAHGSRSAIDYYDAKEAYLLLKNNFNQIGRYEDASWAYIKEQQMEKMAHYREWRSHGWRIWRGRGPFLGWLRNWAYELATGYGERPWNPVIGGGLIMLAFAVAFWGTRAIADGGDALMYSLATFATFNLARSELNPQGPGVEAASSIEALLGIGILALFIFTLGNRMSRG